MFKLASPTSPADTTFLRRRFGERVLAPAVKRAGLPASTTFHGLRHTAVTAMAVSGVTYNTTQGRASHATARMTMEVYSHRTTAADRAAADALEAHFGPCFAGQSGPGVAQGPSSTADGGA